MSRTLSLLALPALGVLLLACSGSIGPPKRPLGTTAFKLTSAEFVKEHKANPTAAHVKYTDKTIELTGKIVACGSEATGSGGHFYLEGPDPEGQDRAVCQMAGPMPWTKATPGQTIKVKG